MLWYYTIVLPRACKRQCFWLFWNLFLPGSVSRLPTASPEKDSHLLTGLESCTICKAVSSSFFCVWYVFFHERGMQFGWPSCSHCQLFRWNVDEWSLLKSRFIISYRACAECFSERSDPRDLLACQTSKLSTAPHSQQYFRATRNSEPSVCHLQFTIEVPHPRIMFQRRVWMRSESDFLGSCLSPPQIKIKKPS